MRTNFDLSCCIRIEETRIARRATLPRQILFELNPELISHLEMLKQQKLDLQIKAKDLVDLRYLALVHSGLLTPVYPLDWQVSGITFTSNYLSNHERSPYNAIRSTINLSGKIQQEVNHELWQNQELSAKIITIHYWLIAQIIKQLPLPRHNYLDLITWSLWLGIITLSALMICYWLSLPWFCQALIILTSCFLLKKLLNYFIKIKLKNWAIKQSFYTLGNRQINLRKLTLWLIC